MTGGEAWRMIANVAAMGTAVRTAALRRVKGLPKFSEWAYRPIEPAIELSCRPALFEPDQIGRVLRCGFDQSIGSEVEKLAATRWTSRPASICELRDVLVLGGHVFHSGGRNLLRDNGVLTALGGRLDAFDSVAVPNSVPGLRYFGHWLRDDCSGHDLAQGFGRVVSIRRPDYRDAPLYAALLGQTWEEHSGFSARRATFLTDIGFSPAKAARLRSLRARLRARCRAAAGAGVVLLRRGDPDPRRNPRNEAALLSRLKQAGVRVVDGDSPIETVIAQILDAEVIIGMEGSQLAHAVFLLQDGGALIALQTPLRFYNPHHEWCRLLGMQYGTVVGTIVEDGFEMDADEVLQMVDRVIGQCRAVRAV